MSLFPQAHAVLSVLCLLVCAASTPWRLLKAKGAPFSLLDTIHWTCSVGSLHMFDWNEGGERPQSTSCAPVLLRDWGSLQPIPEPLDVQAARHSLADGPPSQGVALGSLGLCSRWGLGVCQPEDGTRL